MTTSERRLAAIFAADVAGYARLMSADEVGTFRMLEAHRRVMDDLIVGHGGRIANTAGDSVLAEFPSLVAAVECAVEVQTALEALHQPDAGENALRFRIGIHLGDVLVRAGDLFGDGVNIAARLQALAEPGGICLSGEAHAHVRSTLSLSYEDLGLQRVKNIDHPVSAFAIKPSLAQTGRARAALARPSDKPSLAVLPFANLSRDPEQEYLVEGIVDDLINSLYRVRWLIVIARSSSFAYGDRAVDVRQVGRELGVRYVLGGSIRKSGSRIRVTAYLADAASGAHVWTDRFEGPLEDVFELQDSISESVAGVVEPTIRLAEVERARVKPTDSLDAYDLYLRALPLHYTNDRDRLAEAQRLLARAIAADPNYAVAKAFSALTTVIQTNQGWTGRAEQETGIRLAREALADHRDDPVVLRCAGHALAYLAHEHDTATALLDRALELHPNSAEVHHSAGWVGNFACNGEKAAPHFDRAMRLNPFDPEMGHTLIGMTFAQLLREDYEAALHTSSKAVAAMPGSVSPLRARIVALVQMQRLEEARAVGRLVLNMNPTFRVGEFRKVQPFKDPGFVERYTSALLAAGLPE